MSIDLKLRPTHYAELAAYYPERTRQWRIACAPEWAGVHLGGRVMSGRDLDSRNAHLRKSRLRRNLTTADIEDTVVCGPCGDVVGPADDFQDRGFVMGLARQGPGVAGRGG